MDSGTINFFQIKRAQGSVSRLLRRMGRVAYAAEQEVEIR
jgi:hypothetical protein